MNIPFPASHSGLDLTWTPALQRQGFVAAGDGYRLQGIIARIFGQWLVLETAGAIRWRRLNPLEGSGLWKPMGSGRGRRFQFELPASAVSGATPDQPLDDEDDPSADALLGWALDCAAGKVPRDWCPPANERVASWMPPNALTVRVGPLVRQGELVLAPDRWALNFPILPAVPAGLSPARRHCLALLARDAQERWRMVRTGLVPGPDGDALVARVDLTGAPHSELLFLAGLDGLRHVVSWLAESADLLADVTVTFRSLADRGSVTDNRERKTK